MGQTPSCLPNETGTNPSKQMLKLGKYNEKFKWMESCFVFLYTHTYSLCHSHNHTSTHQCTPCLLSPQPVCIWHACSVMHPLWKIALAGHKLTTAVWDWTQKALARHRNERGKPHFCLFYRVSPMQIWGNGKQIGSKFLSIERWYSVSFHVLVRLCFLGKTWPNRWHPLLSNVVLVDWLSPVQVILSLQQPSSPNSLQAYWITEVEKVQVHMRYYQLLCHENTGMSYYF